MQKADHSIFIGFEDIEVLLMNNATTTHICCFIVIAAARDWGKGQSNARCGADAVSKCVGIGFKKAQNIIRELSRYNYNSRYLFNIAFNKYELGIEATIKAPNLYIRDDLNGLQRRIDYLNNNKDILSQWKLEDKRYVNLTSPINNTGVWFNRIFVGTKNSLRGKSPIYRLNKRHNDIAARLLLILYAWYDYECDGVYIHNNKYISHEVLNKDDIAIYSNSGCKVEPDMELVKYVFGLKTLPGQPEILRLYGQIQDALNILEDEKLIQRVVVVEIFNKINEKLECCYDLHKKGEPLKGSIRRRIRDIAISHGDMAGRKDGRSHDGIYYAIAPKGRYVSIANYYRLPHISWNGKTAKILSRRESYRTQMLDWSNKLENQFFEDGL